MNEQTSAHQMHELSDANRAGVAIPIGGNRDELVVGGHGSGADRGHATVHSVEPGRPAEVIRKGLAPTTNA